MSQTLRTVGGVRVLVCDGDSDGAPVQALDFIPAAWGADAAWVAVPASCLGDDFFRLETRVAGELIQKFVNYGVRLAVTGDISAHVADSGALRDFVYESNRRTHVWFVDDLDDLERRLSRLASRG
jgi:hypothetical protein